MPKDAATTTSAFAALPTTVQQAGLTVEVSLTYAPGKTFDPAALRTALATLGTLTDITDGTPRNAGPYRLQIA
jgi:hypothetical protein